MRKLCAVLLILCLLSVLASASLLFTAGGAVQTQSGAPTFALTNLTIAAHVPFTASPVNSTSTFSTIWSRLNSSGSTTELWYFIDNAGKAGLWVGNAHRVFTGSIVTTSTTWHTYIMTKSGTTYTSYLDCSSTTMTQDVQVTDATAQSNVSGTIPIIFGKNNPGNHPLKGDIAEVAGWNKVLSNDEMVQYCHGLQANRIEWGALLLYIPMLARAGTGGTSTLHIPDWSQNAKTNDPVVSTGSGNVVTDDHCPGCGIAAGTFAND